MSYCRWSSLNWACDLYCYGDSAGGFTTHVAGNRVVGEIPREPDWALIQTDAAEFARQHNAVREFLKTAKCEPIGLAHDGESFHDPDLESFLERLLELRAAGYHFPDFLVDDVREEIAAEAKP